MNCGFASGAVSQVNPAGELRAFNPDSELSEGPHIW